MSKPARFKCPGCQAMIWAEVKETRTQNDWIMRRRRCEKCGIRIVTQEKIIGTYKEKGA